MRTKLDYETARALIRNYCIDLPPDETSAIDRLVTIGLDLAQGPTATHTILILEDENSSDEMLAWYCTPEQLTSVIFGN